MTEKPVVRDGEIVAAHMMGVTLACDHRDPLRRRRRAASSTECGSCSKSPLALAL